MWRGWAKPRRRLQDVDRLLGEEGAASPDEVVALQAYVCQEEEGARQLRRLAADEKQLCGGLFALLLETMALDSEKHAHILRYLLHRARQQAG